MTGDATDEPDLGDEETVPATSYVTPIQYRHWQDEAEKRNQSVSTFISSMVEVGCRQISVEQGSPNEIVELRQQMQILRSEKKELRKKIENTQHRHFEVGMGKIKELIINNDGITKEEIINFVSKNPFLFVEKYLKQLEESEFRNQNGTWHPPEDVGDN